MPTQPTVSAEQVLKAAEQLQRLGEPVTGSRLRRVIGAGNVIRLEELWSKHQNSGQPDKEAAPAAEIMLPPALAEHLDATCTKQVERLQALYASVWRHATEAAELRVRDEVNAAKANAEYFQGERTRISDLLERADERIAKLQEELKEAEEDKREAFKAADRAEAAAAEARRLLDGKLAEMAELMAAPKKPAAKSVAT